MDNSWKQVYASTDNRSFSGFCGHSVRVSYDAFSFKINQARCERIEIGALHEVSPKGWVSITTVGRATTAIQGGLYLPVTRARSNGRWCKAVDNAQNSPFSEKTRYHWWFPLRVQLSPSPREEILSPLEVLPFRELTEDVILRRDEYVAQKIAASCRMRAVKLLSFRSTPSHVEPYFEPPELKTLRRAFRVLTIWTTNWRADINPVRSCSPWLCICYSSVSVKTSSIL